MRIPICSTIFLLTSTLAGAALADDATTLVASPVASATAGDPNLDHTFVLPTAMTQPAGSITYNNTELLLHSVSYGLTDRWQLGATALAPIVKDMPFVGLASLKGQVYRGRRLQLAAQAFVGGVAARGEHADEGGMMMGGAGGLASVCLRQDCSSLLSASLSYQFLGAGRSNDEPHGLLYGLSLVHRVSPHVKLMAELVSDSPLAASAGLRSEQLLSYGVRFHDGNIAGDVGFMRPIQQDRGLVLGMPFASFSYRWR